MKKFFFLLFSLGISFLVSAVEKKPFEFREAEKKPFELRDGDRVAFVGGTFLEREGEHGYLETMLTRHFLERNVIFRNFGWSGDTVDRRTRTSYEPDLFKYLDSYQPTVVLVSYGMMESFQGEAGLAKFGADYSALLKKLAANGARIVMISPIRHENLGGQWPDPTEHNKNLKLYTEAMARIASESGYTFVNLYDRISDGVMGISMNLTTNGIHPRYLGYYVFSKRIEQGLGLAPIKNELDPLAPDPLREAIKAKNEQWWYHYRPTNGEYMYPGGSRYQNKLGAIEFPLYQEVESFAKLAEREDAKIALIRQKLAKGEPIPVAESQPIAPLDLPRGQSEPLDPEDERRQLQVADGFEINLFASDPMINKPISMAFDPKGRLWVASTTTYIQVRPGETARDQIIILEDTQGVGKADKATVFADRLGIPTGVLPGDHGAYVAEDTRIFAYHEKPMVKGESAPDDRHAWARDTVLSGFGTEDTHHKIHSLRWGPGGNLYINQGIFMPASIETPYGIVHQGTGGWNGAGIFEYHPSSGKLGLFVADSEPPNPWGHFFNRWGQSFYFDSSGTFHGFGGVYQILPTGAGTGSMMGIGGGTGKLCQGDVVSGRHFPDDWQGNLIANQFMNNRVNRYRFQDEGAGYSLQQLPPLIVSKDIAFRPVDVKMGPDGALYIADWYNPQISHGEKHFRDPIRDRIHGRIWRVTAKGRPLVPRPQLTNVPVLEVLNHLRDPEDYTRYEARRRLHEMGARFVLPALSSWVKSLDPKDPQFDHHRLEALWVYQDADALNLPLLKSVLRASDPNARAAATLVIRNYLWSQGATPVLEPKIALDLLAKQVTDEHPRVRLQAVIALSHIPSTGAAEIAMIAADRPRDPFLDYVLKLTAQALKPHWLPLFESGQLTFEGNPGRLSVALQAVGSKSAVTPLLAQLKSTQLSPENRQNLLAILASLGEGEQITPLLDPATYMTGNHYDSMLHAQSLAALVRSARQRKSAPGNAQRLTALLEAKEEPVRAEAIRLAGAWKLESARAPLTKIAETDTASDTLRQAALEALADLGGPASIELFLRLSDPQKPRSIKTLALIGLASLDPKIAAPRAVEFLAADSSLDPSPILSAFLNRQGGAEVLATALSTVKISSDTAKLALRSLIKTLALIGVASLDPTAAAPRAVEFLAADSSLDPSPILSAFLNPQGGAEVLATALSTVKISSDTAKLALRSLSSAGRQDRALVQVLSDIAGVGASHGPTDLSTADLKRLADEVRAKGDAVRGEILMHRRDVVCFKCHAIGGVGGNVGPDFVAVGSAHDVEFLIESIMNPPKFIRDGFEMVTVTTRDDEFYNGIRVRKTDKELVLRDATRDEIVIPNADIKQQKEGGSLMPDGLTDSLTHQEFLDLVRFLSELGKPGPFAVNSTTVVRRWQGLDREVWMPAYTTVAGLLPLETFSAVRCEIETIEAGRVRLRVNNATGLSLLLDNQAVESKDGKDGFLLDLCRGLHILTFRMDNAARKDPGLRVELQEISGRTQPVGGR